MRALVIAHDPGSLPTMVGERLVHHGFELVTFQVATFDDPRSDAPFPDPGEFDLVLPMGAVWSVYDEESIGSWIGRELDLIREADRRGVPVFGICFGGQALAAALGGEVRPSPEPQIGWYHIRSDRPDVLAEGPWMQWHHDQFIPPPGAQEIARDDVCSQAFVIGRHLGVQFHPEVDHEHVAMWLAIDEHGDGQQLESMGITAQDLLDQTARCWEQARPHTFTLVDWFLSEVAGLVPSASAR